MWVDLFTKSNYVWAPVMYLGIGKSLIAVSIFGENEIQSGVISKPANSMLSIYYNAIFGTSC